MFYGQVSLENADLNKINYFFAGGLLRGFEYANMYYEVSKELVGKLIWSLDQRGVETCCILQWVAENDRKSSHPYVFALQHCSFVAPVTKEMKSCFRLFESASDL